jgi:hypothetical protein
VLPDATNTHIQTFKHLVVDQINGKKITILQDVYDAFHGDFHEEGHEEYHVVRLVGEERPLVLKREESAVAHDRIKSQYNVSFDHFIEKPEILEIDGLFEKSEDGKEGAKGDKDPPKPESEEKPKEESPKAEEAAPAKKAA